MRIIFTMLIVFLVAGFTDAALAGADAGGTNSNAHAELSRKILQDERMDKVLQMGHDLLKSGMNAGSKYDQVWIRDLNTFIVPLLEAAPQQPVREALLVFLHFQGEDGDIVDGYVSIANARKRKYKREYRYTPTRPELKAHKNTVETDQESSLVQAFCLYIQHTGDTAILDEVVRGIPVRERLEMALAYPLKHRFSEKYGLVWGGTTVDWGDVQPEHPKGVELDENSHRAINIYNNALLMIAIEEYVKTMGADDAALKVRWERVHEIIHKSIREHLWDSERQKFIPHLYLAEGSPFPRGFDENQIFYHGGTAVAIEAGLLNPEEISASLKKMRENVADAGASTIGLTLYPIYPEGFFLNPSFRPWNYQNGGDWTWFGARMVRQLARYGFAAEALAELDPMLDRVLKNDDFFEWWTRDNEPEGAKGFKGSAGVLMEAIVELRKWAKAAATSYADLNVEQITRGPANHFFGYIGHVQNIPWNESERYVLSLRTTFQDHLPEGHEPADVVLIDTQNNCTVSKVEESRGWNPQQGTMFYWNPLKPESQFFFNDRDPDTGKVFTVLYDIERNRRIREYRSDKRPIGNGGVMQSGGWFAGINYARMARLRPVTGYKGAWDWTEDVLHPEDDGIFKVNTETGDTSLLVSFHQIADVIRRTELHIDELALFINHTLWNREGDRLFFFARAGWSGIKKHPRINVPFVINADGTGLKRLKTFFGGHPEWDYGHRMIGSLKERQILYDVDHDLVAGHLGNEEIFPDPEGDVALSPQGDWFVNGHKDKEAAKNYYTFYQRSTGSWLRSQGFDIGPWISGDLRQDPSPTWNRSGTRILVPGLVGNEKPSRQLFVLSLPGSAADVFCEGQQSL